MTQTHSNIQEIATSRVWDFLVIGAGPAGALAALRLAKANHQVLLVDAKEFPREKVCGGCLNGRAWRILTEHGLEKPLRLAGAVPLTSMNLTCLGYSAHWQMPTMMAVSRQLLDSTIVDAAINQGAQFLPSTICRVDGTCWANQEDTLEVSLRQSHHAPIVARAKIVIAADGLNHSSLVETPFHKSQIDSTSRIGMGATLKATDHTYPLGELTMAVGSAGYVGITRVEQGMLRVAAAISPAELKKASSSAQALASILRVNRLPIPSSWFEVNWQGTPPLTRSSSTIAGHRLFLLGDATGYVEPFTGEGMSWALAGAVAIQPILSRALSRWDPNLAGEWQKTWSTQVKNHQRVCRSLAWLLRRPRLAAWSLRSAHYTPWIVRSIMTRVSGEPVPTLSLG